MTSASPIDSASSWLWWSNFLYVAGAVLTFVAAMLVFIERRLIAAGKRERAMLITEFFAVVAAILSFIGTCGAIYFGTVVSHLKDDDLAAHEEQAKIQISHASSDAMTSLQKAVADELKIEELQSGQTTTINKVHTLETEVNERKIYATKASIDHLSNLPSVRIYINSNMADQESMDLYRQFINLFSSAHIGTGGGYSLLIGQESLLHVAGVHFYYDNNPITSEFVGELRKILDHSQIKAEFTSPITDRAAREGNVGPSSGPNKVLILIGPRK